MKISFVSYLDQLVTAAREEKVDLLAACVNAGLPTSTYYRWMQNKANPNDHNARRVFAAIKRMGDNGITSASI